MRADLCHGLVRGLLRGLRLPSLDRSCRSRRRRRRWWQWCHGRWSWGHVRIEPDDNVRVHVRDALCDP